MKRLAALLLLLLSVPIFASWPAQTVITARTLGYAVHTPNTATTLLSTPDAGVTLPTYTKTIVFTVENYPIRYLTGSTAPTATLGILLQPGTYYLENDTRLVQNLRFIDTASGASKVTVEFYGDRL